MQQNPKWLNLIKALGCGTFGFVCAVWSFSRALAKCIKIFSASNSTNDEIISLWYTYTKENKKYSTSKKGFSGRAHTHTHSRLSHALIWRILFVQLKKKSMRQRRWKTKSRNGERMTQSLIWCFVCTYWADAFELGSLEIRFRFSSIWIIAQ